MVDAGISDILLTYNLVGQTKLDRLVALARRADNDGADHCRERLGGLAQRNSWLPDFGYAAIVWPRPVPLRMRAAPIDEGD